MSQAEETSVPPEDDLRQVACFRLGSRMVAVLARCHGRLSDDGTRTSVRFGEHDYDVFDVPARLGMTPLTGEADLLLVEEGAERSALKVAGPARMTRIDPERLRPVPDLYPDSERVVWAGLLPTEGGELLPVLSLAGLLGAP